MHGITNCKDLLYMLTQESFSKGQDVRWICWVRFWLTKLKMLARHL